MDPKPDVAYPVVSKYDSAPFYNEGTDEPWMAKMWTPTGEFNRYVLEGGDPLEPTVASFDVIRQAWRI